MTPTQRTNLAARWARILEQCAQAHEQGCTSLIVAVDPNVKGVGSTRSLLGPGSPVGAVVAAGRVRVSVDDMGRWAASRLSELGYDLYSDDEGRLVLREREAKQ